MAGGKGLEGAGNSGKLISGNGVRYDEHPIMGTIIVEELERELDEIISVPCHQPSLLPGCKLQLFKIRCPHHSNFMAT